MDNFKILTVYQTTLFFEEAAQMGLSNCTRVYIWYEGINTMGDPRNFDKEWSLWINSGRIADATLLEELESSGLYHDFKSAT